VVGGGLGVTIAGSLIDDSITPLTEEQVARLDRQDVNFLDRPATSNYSPAVSRVSDWTVGTLIASPLALAALHDVRSDAATVGVMYLETMLLATFAPGIGKGCVTRTRPFVYNPDAPLDRKLEAEARRSWPSGHTTLAFASAVFLASVYGDYHPDSTSRYYVWGGALLTAAAVGFMRFEAGAHFPTDILSGALLGSTLGWLVPFVHRSRDGAAPAMAATALDSQGWSVSVTVPW
jgi:membrane-associated phospholipid phosphatase